MCACCVFLHCYHPVVKLGFSAAPTVRVERRDGTVFGVMSRLLLVGLLFVSVPRAVLDVGRARAQPVQVTTVLCIIDMILEEHLRWEK